MTWTKKVEDQRSKGIRNLGDVNESQVEQFVAQCQAAGPAITAQAVQKLTAELESGHKSFADVSFATMAAIADRLEAAQ